MAYSQNNERYAAAAEPPTESAKKDPKQKVSTQEFIRQLTGTLELYKAQLAAEDSNIDQSPAH